MGSKRTKTTTRLSFGERPKDGAVRLRHEGMDGTAGERAGTTKDADAIGGVDPERVRIDDAAEVLVFTDATETKGLGEEREGWSHVDGSSEFATFSAAHGEERVRRCIGRASFFRRCCFVSLEVDFAIQRLIERRGRSVE